MLKKTLILSGILSITSFVVAQKTEMDKAYTETCDCLTALDKKKLKPEEKKAEGMSCVQKVMMNHIEALAKDNGYELSEMNEEKGRIIGEKFGQNLVTKCPASISFFMEVSKDQIEKVDIPLTAQYVDHGTSSGTLVRLETTGDTPKMVIKTADGSEETFLWMRPFTGSDNFETNYKTLVNKKVTVEWGEFRKYVFSMKGYSKVREITALKIEK
jgi:hypothetical protein